jgi:hypothetical protein
LYTQNMKAGLARSWDFPSAVLLALILLTVSQRLYATDWAPGLGLAVLLTTAGVVLGLALGASQFKGGGVLWLALGYSLIVIPLAAGGILYGQIPWLERMISLGGRLAYSITLLAASRPVPDTVLFVIFAGLGLWIVSLLAGYALARDGDFARSVIPAGVVLFFIQLYDSSVGDQGVILAIYAFLSLVLMGRLGYLRKRLFWKANRVSFSAESWTDLNIAIPVVALVLILLAWILPANGRTWVSARVAWERLTHPLETIRQDLGNAVAGLKGYEQANSVEFYGDTLALGYQASTGEGVNLRVSVPLIAKADRYYWRVRTYDQYLENQWQSGEALSEPFIPEQNSLPLVDMHGLANEFVFTTPRANLAVLVTPAQPIWVSRPVVLDFFPTFEDFIDPVLFRADPPILVGEQYTVHANIQNPTTLELQQAGTIYPAWVRERYLQLPRNLSPQIIELAQRITLDAKSPYEKATAITDYLRTTITYALTIDPIPEGIDPLVWFLIYTRKGFCNYYATAEVILLRSTGVPARMVVGFAEGEYEPPDKYTILEKDAHAWPEVYFPGTGWVEFEPTTSQPELNRLAGDSSADDQGTIVPADNGTVGNSNRTPEPVEVNGAGSRRVVTLNPLLRLMLIFGLLVLLMGGFFTAYTTGLLEKFIQWMRKTARIPLPILLTNTYSSLSISPPGWLKRWAQIAGLKAIERTFRIVFQSLHWLGAKPKPSQTPAEVAGLLGTILPEADEEIHTLLQEYQHALYSQKHFDLKTARNAMASIRVKALRAAFHQRTQAVRSAFQKRFRGKLK